MFVKWLFLSYFISKGINICDNMEFLKLKNIIYKRIDLYPLNDIICVIDK